MAGPPINLVELKKIFGCDLRTLALLRVWLGLVVLADVLIRARDFTAHYTDAGVVPRGALFLLQNPVGDSLHLLSGSFVTTGFLFLLTAIMAIALIAGYRSRLAAFACLILLISINTRNPFVTQGGDMLLRALLFWLMLLPIGARFSIDSALDNQDIASRQETNYFSFATAGLLVQALCVYFFGALMKSDPVWLPQGLAVHFALANDSLATPIGEWLSGFPDLMRLLTYFVWGIELAAPLLLLSPLFNLQLRLAGMFLLIAMHVGFLLCLDIVLFPFISIASLMAFTRPEVWDWLEDKLTSPRGAGIRIYYEPGCFFCEKTCRILRVFLILPNATIEPADNHAEANRILKAEESWVVYDADGNVRTQWPALAWLISRSPLLGWLGPILSHQSLTTPGNRFYRWVGNHRGLFSQWSHALLPYRTVDIKPGWFVQAFSLVMLTSVLWVNFGTVGAPVPRPVKSIVSAFHVDQRWNMFAPAPSMVAGWFLPFGETADGRTVDVLLGRIGEPAGNRAEYYEANYNSYRWRKYLTKLVEAERAPHRSFYLHYLCRRWNEAHPPEDKLVRVKLYFMAEHLAPPGEQPRRERLLLWQSDCGADPVTEVVDFHRGILPSA